MIRNLTRMGVVRIGTLLWVSLFSPGSANSQESAAAAKDSPHSAAGRDSERSVSIAALQAGTRHYQAGNPGLEANFALFANLAREAAAAPPRPDLICWPEYAISGWPYPKEKVINGLAEPIPGEGHWYRRYRDLARELGVPILGWLVESAEGKLYNTAFLLDGKGEFKGKHRKVQANLGEQTWWGWSQGDRFELLALDGVRYGVSLCADMWFPETVRCQELLGADVVLHLSIADDMGHLIPARAFDSKLPIVAIIFQGGSYAVDAEGKLLGKLPAEDPGWKAFQIHPFLKHHAKKYGGVWDFKKGQQNLRNVGAYSILSNSSTRPPWTEVFMDDAGGPQSREQLLQRFHGRYDAHDPAPSGPATPNGARPGPTTTELGINGTRFTLNGTPTFLYGISYYGALGAPGAFIRRDLAEMKEHGFNWIRVWATWAAFSNNVAAVEADGSPREPFLAKLKDLVAECDRRGMVVDVTFSRGNGVTGPPKLQSQEAHRRAVETIVTTLKPWRNWYLDLANERNVRDQRFVSFAELKELRAVVKRLDPRRLVTASAGSDISRDELREYLTTVGVDLVCPHRPRDAASPKQTEAKSREYLAWMEGIGRVVPLHYQEPLRSGYVKWQPKAEDFVSDLQGARAGGAAGWCFHNGDQRGNPDGQPRRSFDLREHRLFDQLDEVECAALDRLRKVGQGNERENARSLRTVDLDLGEAQDIAWPDGTKARVKLNDLQETRDPLRQAVREARATVEVNGQTITLTSATYRLPVTVAGVQMDCPITRGYTSNAMKNVWGLEKAARLRLWPAGSPLLAPGTFVYPVKQRWFATATQMANEPVYVNQFEAPGNESIYYHYGLDIGGAEGLVEVVAATDGLVVSSGKEVLPGHEDAGLSPGYDEVNLLDAQGWYYCYAHLKTIDPALRTGQPVKKGQRLGVLGKEGGSGGWAHLHFAITSRQPSGKWGVQEGYAFLWEAYLRQYSPKLIAVARPPHFASVGGKLKLDGTRSWSAAGKIVRYEWTFTDGSTATGAQVERSYGRPGTYSEILKVTDSEGRVNYDLAVVQVADEANLQRVPPTIHATYTPTFGLQPGDAVTFKVRTFLAPDDGEEKWDFGDGTPPVTVKSDGNVKPLAPAGYAVHVHRYNKPGDYLVKVERTDKNGYTAIGRLHVRVGKE